MAIESHHLPLGNGAGLGGEVHADAQEAARVGNVGAVAKSD